MSTIRLKRQFHTIIRKAGLSPREGRELGRAGNRRIRHAARTLPQAQDSCCRFRPARAAL